MKIIGFACSSTEISASFRKFQKIVTLVFLFTLPHAADSYSGFVQGNDAPGTLKDAFENSFLIGAAISNAQVTGSDPEAQAVVIEHFNSITPENVMKPEPLNPVPGEWNFEPADRFVEFGEQHGMFMVGHTLIWHNQTPDWFFHDDQGNPLDRDTQIERMRSHIEIVAGRYSGRVHAWDVVNEAIHEDGSFRPTPWYQSIGEDFVRLAFEFAHEYAPDAELYYNDFNAWRPSKRDGIMRLVRSLQENGVRIDGIGIQGHWGLDYPKTEYIEAAIDSFASLGVQVMITELDVDVLPISRTGQLIGNVMQNYQWQLEEFREFLDPYRDGLPEDVQHELAERYAELFRIFQSRSDKISRVTLWGVHDGMSWKNNFPVPGRINYPLLFDRDRRPKPALEAVIDVGGDK